MHDDRELAERRIDRDLWERVLPLVHADRASMSIEAGPSPGELTPFVAGSEWGAPWQTTWFRFSADVPAGWDDRPGTRVEAVVDLGFTLAQAGFQAEGLVVSRTDGTPVQGIHPDRTCVVIEADELATGRVVLLVEAASNPTFVQFAPSSEGLPETASADPIYRFRTADLVLVDLETEALVHDLDVLDDTMRSLALADPRRAKIRRSIIIALDALPEVDDARRALATHLRPITLDGDVDGGGDGDVHGHAGDARRHRIIATGHAHIDTAWLWPIRETIRKCTRTFASAVGLMDDDPTFRFTCSQAQQYAWIEERHPELFARIRAAAERGQWLPVGGMWVESDMNLPSGESLARQIVHGQRYFTDRFGAPCREMWIPDVFGYPAGLPQLFVAGGMDRFVTQKLSWNKQNRFPHHTFRWEGLDGTSVLTHFPPVDTYNAQIRPSEIAHSIRNFREHAWSDVSLMPFGHGDGGGGPTREMLERARRIADVDPSVSLEIGSVDDFFTAVEDEAVRGAPVPVWRGELYFETHRGTLTSQLRTKIGNRRCERLLVEAELWEAALAVAGTTGTATATGSEASALGGSADELMTLDEAWKQLLTQQFHDILPGSSIAWVHRDAEETFERVAREVTRRIDRSLAGLARSRPALANPSGVAISGVVVVADGGAVADEDRLASSGRAPQHVQRLADDSVAFAAEVPAFGIAPIDPQPVTDRVVLTDCSMTNGQLCVRWNKHGDITSIIDTVARREIVPPGALLAAIELAGRHDNVFATVGLHPHDATNGTDSIVDLLDTPGIVAIGEAGLDYYYEHSPRDQQRTVFAEHIALAHERDLTLVIHTRDAWDETFEILDAEGVPERTIFHCFTGGPDAAAKGLERGIYLSLSGIVTFNSAKDVQEAAALCPADKLLIETDSPYLAPVPHRGKQNRPAWVPHVGQFLADLRDEPVDDVAAATVAATHAAFGHRLGVPVPA